MLSRTEGDPCRDVPRQQRSARGSLRMRLWEVALRGTGAEVPRRPLASQSRGLFHAPCARRRRRPHGRLDGGRRVRRARRQEPCGPARAEGPTSAPPLPCRLLLMALYNVSINLKGLRYISESPGFVPLLWWLLSGKEGSPHSSPAAPTPVLCGRRGW